MAAFTSGPKIFPICPEEAEESDVGKLTFYPIGVDWATLFKWYFRVKTWEGELDITFNASASQADVSASVTAPSPITQDTTSNMEDETDFSCTTPIIVFQSGAISEYQEDSSEEAIVSASLASSGCRLILFAFKTFYQNDTYYPYIRIDFNSSGNAGGFPTSSNTFVNYFSTPNVPIPDSTQVDVPVEIDGIMGVVQWTYQKSSYNDVGASSDVNLIINNIKLTPKEYWEYDPGDGAYYDSTDGSELRDPWSYQP